MVKGESRKGGIYLVIDCEVIQDLIPLVNDGAASEASVRLVREHCSQCSACNALTVDQTYNRTEAQTKDQQNLKTLKRSIYSAQLILAVIGILVGIWFSDSNNVLYNFYLMPLVGGLGYFALGRRSFWIPLVTAGLTELFALIRTIPLLDQNLVQNFRQMGESLTAMLFFAVIYAALSALGIAIAALLKYAFGRDRNDDEK